MDSHEFVQNYIDWASTRGNWVGFVLVTNQHSASVDVGPPPGSEILEAEPIVSYTTGILSLRGTNQLAGEGRELFNDRQWVRELPPGPQGFNLSVHCPFDPLEGDPLGVTVSITEGDLGGASLGMVRVTIAPRRWTTKTFGFIPKYGADTLYGSSRGIGPVPRATYVLSLYKARNPLDH